jgi:adenine phosphoribosyltransferase
LLADGDALRMACEQMAAPFRTDRISRVAGIESRGFILGAAVARELSVGFIPIRKPGKLPSSVTSVEYQLEYGTDRLEVHADSCERAERILIVDDVLATGGTANAACQLIERVGATVAGLSFLMILGFLNGEDRLRGRRIESVLRY